MGPSWTHGRTSWPSVVRAVGKDSLALRHRAGTGPDLAGKVLFSPCSLLVQDLLIAKRDLRLSRCLKRLSSFEVLIIDDLGYVQQSREEMEVLFTLLAERYERGSVMITSNLPFSKWESIFKDPMTTAAAIDRSGAPQRDPGVERAELPAGAGSTGPLKRQPSRWSPTPSQPREPEAGRVVRLRSTNASKGGFQTGIIIVAEGKCNCRRSPD